MVRGAKCVGKESSEGVAARNQHHQVWGRGRCPASYPGLEGVGAARERLVGLRRSGALSSEEWGIGGWGGGGQRDADVQVRSSILWGWVAEGSRQRTLFLGWMT